MELIPALTIECVERPATTLVSPDEYSTEGVVIGPNRNFDSDWKAAEGHSVFILRLEASLPIQDGVWSKTTRHHHRIQSAWFSDAEPLQRQQVLRRAYIHGIDSFIKQIMPNEPSHHSANPQRLESAERRDGGKQGIDGSPDQVPGGDAASAGSEGVRPGSQDADGRSGVVGECDQKL
jgi:hypothetical protein